MYKFDPTIMYRLNAGNIKIICIEGIIAAGKSTIIQILRSKYSKYKDYEIIFIDEPIDEWTKPIVIPSEYRQYTKKSTTNQNMLGFFYSDMKQNAFAFQINAFCSRTKSIYNGIKEIIESGKKAIIVTERSVISDKYIFTKNLIKQGFFRDEEIVIYDDFYNTVASLIEDYVEVIIGINTSTVNAMLRTVNRNRIEESNISQEYQIQLMEMHNEMYDHFSQDKLILTFEWDSYIGDLFKYVDDKKVLKDDWQEYIENEELMSNIYQTFEDALDFCISSMNKINHR